jgi:hypothetical protein
VVNCFLDGILTPPEWSLCLGANSYPLLLVPNRTLKNLLSLVATPTHVSTYLLCLFLAVIFNPAEGQTLGSLDW